MRAVFKVPRHILFSWVTEIRGSINLEHVTTASQYMSKSEVYNFVETLWGAYK